jgi:hypothetical protein
VVVVLPLVRRDHEARILGRPLHALLHRALAVGASVVAPETYNIHTHMHEKSLSSVLHLESASASLKSRGRQI